MSQSKNHFTAGDVVRLKQDVSWNRDMIVDRVVFGFMEVKVNKDGETNTIGKKTLTGVQCFWFTDEGYYQSNIFSTKDLEYSSTKSYRGE